MNNTPLYKNSIENLLTKLLAFLIVCFCFFAFSSQAQAASVASGTCGAYGSSARWDLSNNGTLTIKGSGEMADYLTSSPPWFAWKDNIRKIVVENGVTSIGNTAFERLYYVESIKLPKSLTSINDSAFNCCMMLKSITVPKGVTYIGPCAFGSCNNLEKIKLEKGNKNYVTDENGVLFNRKKTTLLQYPAGNRNKAYAVPSGVNRIEDFSFVFSLYLEKVTMPSSVNYIGAFAFAFCAAMKEISVPASVGFINDYALEYCDNLKRVYIINPKCSFGVGCFSNSPVTLYGFASSSTQSYARQYGLSFSTVTKSNHAHQYGPATIIKATLKKDGARTKYCSICGKKVRVTTARVSSIKLSKTASAYTGKAFTPTVVIKDRNGKTLKKGTDYLLRYSNGRSEIGKYKIKITFKGNYKGTVTKEFCVVPAKVTGLAQSDEKGINLKWDAVKYADYYEIYLLDDTNGDTQFFAKTDKLIFGNSNVKRGKMMCFKVRAVVKGTGGKEYRGAFSKELIAVAK